MPTGIIFLIIYAIVLLLATYLLLSEKINEYIFSVLSVAPIIFLFTLLYLLSGWSIKEQNVFIDDCVDGVTRNITHSEALKLCNCILDDVMEDFNNPNDALNADFWSYTLECLES